MGGPKYIGILAQVGDQAGDVAKDDGSSANADHCGSAIKFAESF